jgi:ABC-type Fe3+-hydroxamate transport system substrate-binding protein
VPTIRLRDDLNRDVISAAEPRRIVSLVPSDTYTLVRLGVGDRVVGRTRYCDDVPGVPAGAAVVGGTKDLDVDAILALQPDLIVANQEENSRAPLEKLAGRAPLLGSRPRRAADGVAHIARLVRLLRMERDPVAAAIVRDGYAALKADAPAEAVPVFVPIWMDPLMTFNAETFGSDMLALAGARNVFADRLRLYPLAADLGKSAPLDAGERDVRYPRVTLEEVRARAPKVVLLPDEPHAFTADDERVIAAALPDARIARVSGKDLFWYGAWQLEALPRLRALIAAIR